MTASSRRDFTQIALEFVKRVTGEAPTPAVSQKQQIRRQGGLRGGASRAAALTAEQRSEIARRAAQTRWMKS